MEENPLTVDDVAGIVSYHSSTIIPDCSYTPQFIVHFINDEEISSYDTPQSLLEYYETVIHFDEASQTKLTDSKIEKLEKGYKIMYYFNDISLFPEDSGDGYFCSEEYLTLKNVYTIFIYNNGDRFDLIFGSDPNGYEKDISKFENTVNSFKIGTSFERLSSIKNYD